MHNKNIKIEIDKDTAQGKYSNIVVTANSKSEFIFDFAKILPGLSEAKVHTRIIMSPIHAKLFLKSLEQTISNYEKTFGDIDIESNKDSIGFKKQN